MINLINHTILVTGASSGIGRQVAIDCAKAGARLIITGRDIEKLNETVSLLEGENHLSIVADLTDEKQLETIVNSIDKINGLVHSAGIIYPLPVKFIRQKHIDEVMNINFNAPVKLTSLLLKNGKLDKKSSIVFISSVSTKHPYFGGALYVSSKSAIEAYAKTLALELANDKTRVNVVSPALVKTDIWKKTIEASGESNVEEYEKQYPLGFGEPEDVSNMITFFLSNDSRWITGQNIIMDGGLTLNAKK